MKKVGFALLSVVAVATALSATAHGERASYLDNWYDPISATGSAAATPIQVVPSAGTYLLPRDGSPPMLLGPNAAEVAWAPDGRHLAIIEEGETSQLLIRDVLDPGVQAVVFARTRYLSKLVWSPDGRWIAFEAPTKDTANGLWVVSADGATTTLVDPEPDATNYLWTPDSQALTVIRTAGNDFPYLHSLVNLSIRDGAVMRELLPAQTQICPREMAWSPDGSALVFSAGGIQNPCGAETAAGLWLADADGGAPQLLAADRFMLEPRWTADGRILVLALGDGLSPARVLLYTQAGSALTLATSSLRGSTRVYLAGETVLYLDGDREAPTVTAVGLNGTNARSLTPTMTFPGPLALSPDGSVVAWSVSNTIGGADLVIVRTDGSGVSTVAGGRSRLVAVTWAPDSMTLVVDVR